MPLVINDESFKALAKIRCDIKFRSIDGELYCSLTDSMTKEHVGSASGWNEQAACDKALAKIGNRIFDTASAETLQKTTKTQAEKIEQLEAELAKLKPAETRKQRRAASNHATTAVRNAPDTGKIPPGTPSVTD
tara:strand:- start:476 stop:877 length:402 start_codon:yes stop_codon:yes gene_type:complete